MRAASVAGSAEAEEGRHHPVGIAVAYPEASNGARMLSAADWISVADSGGYVSPTAGGRRRGADHFGHR
jgi:hypothetical protein